MNKLFVQKLLMEIVELNSHCEKRCLEKMDATTRGFGKNNDVESISFHENGATLTVVDGAYDLRDLASISIDLDEICMTDDDWNNHLISLRQEIEKKREDARQKELIEEKTRRKKKYLELQKEFG